MKLAPIFTLWASCVSLVGLGQNTTISGNIPFAHTNPTVWHERYAKEINYYKTENKKLKNKACDVLFLGSSTLSFWRTIYEDFAPLKIIRRSYGGATLRDMFYNYKVIARGYEPKKIVLYVENDLSGGSDSLTAVKCFDLFRLFIARLKKDYPQSKLFVVSVKPSPSRQSQAENRFLVNNLLRINASDQGYTFVDVTRAMHHSDGTLRTDIFLRDNLHMNAQGYRIWLEILKPLLFEE